LLFQSVSEIIDADTKVILAVTLILRFQDAWRSGCITPRLFMVVGTVRRRLASFMSRLLNPRERCHPFSVWQEAGWTSYFRCCREDMEKEKVFNPCQGSNNRSSVFQPVHQLLKWLRYPYFVEKSKQEHSFFGIVVHNLVSVSTV